MFQMNFTLLYSTFSIGCDKDSFDKTFFWGVWWPRFNLSATQPESWFSLQLGTMSLVFSPSSPCFLSSATLVSFLKQKKWHHVISEEIQRKHDSLCLCLFWAATIHQEHNWMVEPSYSLEHQCTMASAVALYCALITAAWLKIPWISVRDHGTWQKTKTPSSQKWQQHHQKTTTEDLESSQRCNKNIFTRPKRASSSPWSLA